MVRIVYCSVCGKMLHGIVRNCSYCSRSLCKKHCVNGLCPDHQHTMTAKQSKQLNRQINSSLWVITCTCPIGLFALMFGIFGLIWGESKIFGIVCMSIFVVVVVIVTTLILRKKGRRLDVIHAEINQDRQQLVSICPSCGGSIKASNSSCSNCGTHVDHSISQLLTPPQNANYEQEHHIPSPPGWTPNPQIDRGLQEIVDANPESKIEVTGFYDEATNSGYHICKHCSMRFETKGDTQECPYCRKPIYG